MFSSEQDQPPVWLLRVNGPRARLYKLYQARVPEQARETVLQKRKRRYPTANPALNMKMRRSIVRGNTVLENRNQILGRHLVAE